MNIEQELRRDYNPEDSILRKHQMRMLDILLTLDNICKKHNISYWLSSGTLIGGVRHKGFIPWDDDLDVEIMRKDYLRLIKILPGELPADMALQTRSTDKNYTSIYAKIRDLNSCLSETNDYDRVFKFKGIYIDLFPMERIPYSLAWVAAHMHGHIYKILKNNALSEASRLKRINRFFVFNTKIGFPILRFLSKCWPGKIIRHSLGTAFFAPRYQKDLFPLTEIQFEGYYFPAPGNTDGYLRRIYGDYMKLPPLDQRGIHINDIKFLE